MISFPKSSRSYDATRQVVRFWGFWGYDRSMESSFVVTVDALRRLEPNLSFDADGSKRQEIKLQETKKPANLRANAMPVDGCVLSIVRKFKKRYETAKEATAAGVKLKQGASGLGLTPVEFRE
jgi:hypothetical protein